jgi:predicted nucleic acid-binding protein
MKRIFVDTSAWFAFVNRRDPDHRRVRDVLRSFEGRLVTSNFVFDEIVTLLRFRVGHESATALGDRLLDSTVADLVRLTADDEQRAWTIFGRRLGQHFSFTDCTSFALMRRLGITEVAALDDNFAREGFTVLPAG